MKHPFEMSIWVFPKNRGKTPKMDGENNGKPYEQMGWFGGKTHHFRKPLYWKCWQIIFLWQLLMVRWSPVFPQLECWSSRIALIQLASEKVACLWRLLDTRSLAFGIYVNLVGFFVDGFLGMIQPMIGRDWLVENWCLESFSLYWLMQLWRFKTVSFTAGAFLRCFASCSRTFGRYFIYVVSWMALAFCHLNHCLESAVFFSRIFVHLTMKRFRTLLCTKLQAELTGFSFFRSGAVESRSNFNLLPPTCCFSFGCFVSSVLQLGKEATHFSPLFFFKKKGTSKKLQGLGSQRIFIPKLHTKVSQGAVNEITALKDQFGISPQVPNCPKTPFGDIKNKYKTVVLCFFGFPFHSIPLYVFVKVIM